MKAYKIFEFSLKACAFMKAYKLFDLFAQFMEVSDNSLEERSQVPMSATGYCQFKWLGFIHLF